MAKITDLDRQYAAACQDRLLHLRDRLAAELVKARQSLGQAVQRESEFPLFLRLFDALWNNLTSGLEGFLRGLSQQREMEDLEFKKQVQIAIANCRQDPGIPTLDEIETRRDRVGGYPNAYYQYLNEIRAHLSQHFLTLDEGLKQAIERVKSRVADVLIEQGRLGNLTPVRGREFLGVMAEWLPEDLQKLKLGFRILDEFNLSYRGLIQHRIRQQLDGLNPDKTGLKLSQQGISASEVLGNLKTLHAEAVYNCESALEDLLIEPNQAAFAIVEEFVDRVLRVEGVKTEWQIFLEQVRFEVWQDEFDRLGSRDRLRRDWLTAVDTVEAGNQLELMQFLPGNNG